MFVGGVVVENDVENLADRDFPLDGVEKANELLMAMAPLDSHVAGRQGNPPTADVDATEFALAGALRKERNKRRLNDRNHDR
jgi:hypothetical protein